MPSITAVPDTDTDTGGNPTTTTTTTTTKTTTSRYALAKTASDAHVLTVIPPVVPPKWPSYQAVALHALRGGARSFLVAFALRGGVTFAIRLIRVLRGRESLANAVRSFFNVESHRFARMIGAFSFLWKLVNNGLSHYRRMGRPASPASVSASVSSANGSSNSVYDRRESKAVGFIAGAIAGTAILFESEDNRVGIAQQLFMRSMQAGYNALKTRNLFSFTHGDTALFCLSTASILYAYVRHPDTIPPAYYSWMVRTARVPKPIVEFNRANMLAWDTHGDTHIDPQKVLDTIAPYHPPAEVGEGLLAYLARHNSTMPTVPCTMIHPTDAYCAPYAGKLWLKVFWQILPVYAALNGVPMLLLKTNAFLKNPIKSVTRVITNSTRSSAFLAFFVQIFQTSFCASRTLWPSAVDNKYTYYVIGAMSGLAILLEHKPRRAELAMYTLPKGLQSLYLVLLNRGRMVRVPGLDVMATSVAMGVLMSVYQVEPHQMSGLLYKMMKGVLGTY
ncbi:hypothetical protein BC831DRAFT_423527 [Entophlyctis helioformis]|nr:hypothetical protein BC831DRAFT_423527 [Entophlyctis helioformis]